MRTVACALWSRQIFVVIESYIYHGGADGQLIAGSQGSSLATVAGLHEGRPTVRQWRGTDHSWLTWGSDHSPPVMRVGPQSPSHEGRTTVPQSWGTAHSSPVTRDSPQSQGTAHSHKGRPTDTLATWRLATDGSHTREDGLAHVTIATNIESSPAQLYLVTAMTDDNTIEHLTVTLASQY